MVENNGQNIPITPCLEKVTKLSSVISFMMGKCVILNVSLLVLILFINKEPKEQKEAYINRKWM
jgi:hypothetical protein